MASDKGKPTDLELRAVSGPTAVSFRLQPPGPATIGRRSANALQLNDPAVSRDHARLSFRPARGISSRSLGGWLLDDVGSTHGTWLNGVRLKHDRQFHLRPDDLIVVGPWTLLVVDRQASSRPESALATLSDTGFTGTVVSAVDPACREAIPGGGHQLLLKCSEQIHAARSEAAVAEAALDAAVAGTSFTRVAFLRVAAGKDVVEVVAYRGAGFAEGSQPRLKRALIRQASSGRAVRLRRGKEVGEGILGTDGPDELLGLCVPIMVESTLLGFLYLDSPLGDSRGEGRAALTDAFPLVVGRLASLGMSNLMRIDIERRRERMEAELEAAAEAQRLLLPPRTGQSGPFTYVGETWQGQCIGGDFFDVIPLGNERLAVMLGDVGGKGIPVSVLVSASQGFLHACLQERQDPALAVTRINHLYHSRIGNSSFLKTWVGVFDAKERTLTYVAAGHGCALTIRPGGQCELLATGENLAVGIKPEPTYESRRVGISPGVRTLLLSDGFIEQRAHDPRSEESDDPPESAATSPPQRFGIARVQQCLQRARVGEEEVTVLFSALQRHAGTTVVDDDATALLIRW